jgi:uncharacterized protein YjbI with pentapeptide repeats
MPIDPKDVGELQRALNDAAGKASVLWSTFVIFQLYLAIAFGSVTHRDLFLETPIKLPLLNVDLPLIGFFVVTPVVLLIFHFYVFLQLLGLASKAKDYNTLLLSEALDESDRQYVRQRLDVFPILQFLAGPKNQRTGFRGFSLRLMAWITLVGAPILILLQGQVTFLPYHRQWVVWLQRVAVLIDLMVVWYFWVCLRSDNDPIRWMTRKAKIYLSVGVSLCVLIFSIHLATFPGEWLDNHLPELRYIPTAWRPHWSKEDDWTSLQQLLFKGEVDRATGRPRSVFSNRLVLTDQSFVVDPDKLEKVNISRSFRGRDLRQAVLSYADLRKADFSYATLNGADLGLAKLQNALFDHTRLQDVMAIGVQLQGARLKDAQLQGAVLFGAELQGIDLTNAQLQGARLDLAELQGAWLEGAQLQGAHLNGAHLQGAWLAKAQLQGAWLQEAQLQGATLNGAHLQGAWLAKAQLQGAGLQEAQLQGAVLRRAAVWRAYGIPNVDLADLENIDLYTKSPSGETTFAQWRDAIADGIPAGPRRDMAITFLLMLAPEVVEKPEDDNFWKTVPSSQPKDEERDKKRGAFLANLACSTDSAPYLARSLMLNVGAEFQLQPSSNAGPKLFADQLGKGKSDPTACPGVGGFTKMDWARFDELVAAVRRPAPN